MLQEPLVIFPLPEYGHLAPTLPVARHFSGLGHSVLYLAPQHFQDAVASAGAELIPLTPVSGSLQAVSGQRIWAQLAPQASPGQRARVIAERLTQLAGTYKRASFLLDRHFTESFGCDVEAALGQRRHLHFSTSLLPWHRGPHRLLREPTLVFCPSEIEVSRFRDRGEQCMYVEPSLPGFTEGKSLPAALGSRPLILVLWGTQSARYRGLPDLMRFVIELARSRPDCFFMIGMSAHPAARLLLSAELPENTLVQENIAQAKVLPFAAAVLTHGGLGTIKECIAAAVPMVVMPFLADQPFNAIRVTAAGAGSSVFPEEQNLSSLQRELDVALAGTYSLALGQLQALFQERELRKPSYAIIERLLLS